MATTHQDTNVNQLVINKMTKQEYDNLSQVSDTELYLVEEQVDNVVTQNSTNPVQSGAVYEALQNVQNLTADDGIDITNNVISTKIDNDTIQFNSNGEMYCANAGSLKQVDCSTYRGVAGEIVQHIGYNNTSLNLINGHIYKLGTEQRTRLVVSENDFIQAGNYDYVGPYPSSISTSIYSDYGMDHYTWVTNKPFANLAVGDLFWKLPYNDTDYHNVAEVQRVAHIAESSVVLDNGIVLYSLSQLHQFSVNLAEGYSDGNIILFKNQDDYFLGGLFIPINSYITETTYDALVWQPIGVQSYNDLSDKPLSVESSKVKYTLSDGTTKLTLALESELFSGNYNDLTDKPFQNFSFVFPDYKTVALLIDVTDWYDNNSQTTYNYNLFANVFAVRTYGNCEPSGTFNIAAKANWARGYLVRYSKNTFFSVSIVSYNSHKYIAMNKSNSSSTNVYMHGYMTSLLSTPIFVNTNDVTILYQGSEY